MSPNFQLISSSRTWYHKETKTANISLIKYSNNDVYTKNQNAYTILHSSVIIKYDTLNNYLNFRERVVEKSDVGVAVYDGEVCRQRFKYHVRSNVHLTIKIPLSVGTGTPRARVFSVVEARYRLDVVLQYLASVATDSDEQEVVD